MSKKDVENINFELTKYLYSLKLERNRFYSEARKTRNVKCRETALLVTIMAAIMILEQSTDLSETIDNPLRTASADYVDIALPLKFKFFISSFTLRLQLF